MTTGLWAAVSGLPAAAVLAAVPPACRRTVDAATAWSEGDAMIVETPAWPADGATHFVPAFSALTDAPFSVRLELSARTGGAWSPWVAGVGLGPAPFAPLADAPPLSVDVDVFRAAAPVDAVRLRARVRAPVSAAIVGAPWLLTLSAADSAPAAPGAVTGRARLAVPALSQMETDAAIARRICSPACVAMVLDFWRRPVAPAALAAEMFHPGTDLYGVWPAAVLAAGRRGIAGYLLRFPDWSAAAWCLEQGLPVIASIRYAAGELSNAAIAETSGHLIVLAGIDHDHALVNDPAAATAGTVPRRYEIAELSRVWLDRTGVGYVLFPPRR
ncbi:MAG TPA: C39 family peptidase [Candidatus Binatia bacterium]|nr:C39 family peptidase [Candidatus Binatia bacterium]